MTSEEDSKTLSSQRYSRFAQRYVNSATHAAGAELDLLLEIAQPDPGWVMLDIATGGGHTALKFAPQVAKVIATDLTLLMLKAARTLINTHEIENVRFLLADAENLPFEPGCFDLVTCRIAAHHFPDARRFVQESARVLKLGGTLLVQDHLLPENDADARYIDAFEKLRDPSHNRAFNQEEWQTMFAQAGLQVTQVEWIPKRHDFKSWAERQDCSPEVIRQLVTMLDDAPPGVKSWMRPQDTGTDKASFENAHILIAGRKE